MPNVSSFGAQTDNAVVSGTVTDRQMIIPEVPPQGLMSVGPRVTPNFVKPREWNAQTTYHFFDAVRDTAGNAYIATKPVVPAGTPLTDEGYWFLWADPDTRFDDLNETVKTFNQRITQNTSAIAAEVARATATEATKAPVNHASEETVYGIGNEVNYGHVRLASDDTPLTSDANGGVAATPKMIVNAQGFDDGERNILMLGNSYTTGWGESTYAFGISKQVRFAFDHVYESSDSACGFVKYAGHDYNFYTNLVWWYEHNTDKAATITDIAINSAVGDAFCYDAISSFGSDANNTLVSIANYCQTHFPNLKRLRVFMCDALYKTERHSNELNVDTSLLTLARLHRYFSDVYYFNSTEETSYNFEISYCGWVGYNLINTEYMNNSDNVHPNKSGYIKLAKNWLAAYNGTLNNALKRIGSRVFNADAFAVGTKLVIDYVLDPAGYIKMLVALNGITEGTTLVNRNNWVNIQQLKYITAKFGDNQIINIQPGVNFRISSLGILQLRGETIDTRAINRNDVYLEYSIY